MLRCPLNTLSNPPKNPGIGHWVGPLLGRPPFFSGNDRISKDYQYRPPKKINYWSPDINMRGQKLNTEQLQYVVVVKVV